VKDPQRPEPDSPQRPRSDEKPSADKQPPKASGLDYVFKIAPADPKNSFDFEDVADK
jgi:hypothetical protein